MLCSGIGNYCMPALISKLAAFMEISQLRVIHRVYHWLSTVSFHQHNWICRKKHVFRGGSNFSNQVFYFKSILACTGRQFSPSTWNNGKTALPIRNFNDAQPTSQHFSDQLAFYSPEKYPFPPILPSFKQASPLCERHEGRLFNYPEWGWAEWRAHYASVGLSAKRRPLRFSPHPSELVNSISPCTEKESASNSFQDIHRAVGVSQLITAGDILKCSKWGGVVHCIDTPPMVSCAGATWLLALSLALNLPADAGAVLPYTP